MECQIGTILAPNLFWVCKNSPKDKKSIKQLEFIIAEEINQTRSIKHNIIVHTRKQVVIESLSRKGVYHRGYIEKVKNSSCRVFLIDYGYYVEVDISKVYEVDDDAFKIAPAAFKVCLFGVFPTIWDRKSDGTKARRIAEEWSGESLDFVQKLFDKNETIYIDVIETTDDIQYAEIHLDYRNKRFSLKDLLIEYCEAFYHDKEFHKRVINAFDGNVTSSSDSRNGSRKYKKSLRDCEPVSEKQPDEGKNTTSPKDSSDREVSSTTKADTKRLLDIVSKRKFNRSSMFEKQTEENAASRDVREKNTNRNIPSPKKENSPISTSPKSIQSTSSSSVYLRSKRVNEISQFVSKDSGKSFRDIELKLFRKASTKSFGKSTSPKKPENSIPVPKKPASESDGSEIIVRDSQSSVSNDNNSRDPDSEPISFENLPLRKPLEGTEIFSELIKKPLPKVSRPEVEFVAAGTNLGGKRATPEYTSKGYHSTKSGTKSDSSDRSNPSRSNHSRRSDHSDKSNHSDRSRGDQNEVSSSNRLKLIERHSGIDSSSEKKYSGAKSRFEYLRNRHNESREVELSDEMYPSQTIQKSDDNGTERRNSEAAAKSARFEYLQNTRNETKKESGNISLNRLRTLNRHKNSNLNNASVDHPKNRRGGEESLVSSSAFDDSRSGAERRKPTTDKFSSNRNVSSLRDHRRFYDQAYDTSPFKSGTEVIFKPGIRTSQMEEYLANLTSAPSKLILHVGTNDVKSRYEPWLIEESSMGTEYYLSLRGNAANESISKTGSYVEPFCLVGEAKAPPKSNFTELNVSPSILTYLKHHFKTLTTIQRYAIPAIKRNQNVVMINYARTGKTFSYVVPVIDFIQDESRFEEMPPGNGPHVIVLCSSSRSAESTCHKFHALLGNYSSDQKKRSEIKILTAHGSGCEEEVWPHLTNGCHILISTPHCLARLMEYPVLTNFDRLTCMILDEADVITEAPFAEQTEKILREADYYSKNRYQKIICSEKWTREIERLVFSFQQNYAIFWGSQLEAAIYARLKPHTSLINNMKEKCEILLQKIKDSVNKRKILIVCENSVEVRDVCEFLRANEISPLEAHEKVDRLNTKEIATRWKFGTIRNPILVCTDSLLCELNIKDAQHLVHYSLPYKSKMNFDVRFSTVTEHYKNFFSRSNFEETKSEKTGKLSEEPIVNILIDLENHLQLGPIVEFLKRSKCNVKEEILKKCEEIKILQEMQKEKTPICTNLLQFGECPHSKSCPRRHAFNKDLDASRDLPTSGSVAFRVLAVLDGCCFSARLLERFDSEINYNVINMQVEEYFKSEENQRTRRRPEIGDVCAVKDGNNRYRRARVIEVVKKDEHEQATEVNVKLIDEGNVVKFKCLNLYELDETLASFPPQAVDVILCGLLPKDFDGNWSLPAVDFAEDLLTRKLKDRQFWSGRIILSLKNVLCLDSVELREYLPELKTSVMRINVKDLFLKKKLAVKNHSHLEKLRLLRPEIESTPVCTCERFSARKLVQMNSEPEWAFFDGDFIRVNFLAATNSSTVFVQISKFKKLLQNLEADCQEEAKKSKKKESGEFEGRKYCLALYEEDRTWNRARIESELADGKFFVFFVDHGDFSEVEKSGLLPISDKLLQQLPFQAIECSLIGIEHPEQPTEGLINEIYDFSRDGVEELYVAVINKDLDPSITDGRKYAVNLLSLSGVSLNKQLVDNEIIPALDLERNYLEDYDVAISDDEEMNAAETEEVINVPEVVKPEKPETVESEVRIIKNIKDEDYVYDFDKFDPDDVFDFVEGFAVQHGFEKECWRDKLKEKTKEIPEKEIFSKPKRLSSEYLLQLHEKSRSTNAKKPEAKQMPPLKAPENIFTPTLLWDQTHTEVHIKIKLENIEEYALDCSSRNLFFRCKLNDKVYVVDLKLFGAFSPSLTVIKKKTFYFHVILKKLCSEEWPRLTLSKTKYRWIQVDPTGCPEMEVTTYERLVKETQERMRKGDLKMPKTPIHVNPVPFTDSEDEDASEDTFPEEEDPFDPLT